jgi:hypothetical protein
VSKLHSNPRLTPHTTHIVYSRLSSSGEIKRLIASAKTVQNTILCTLECSLATIQHNIAQWQKQAHRRQYTNIFSVKTCLQGQERFCTLDVDGRGGHPECNSLLPSVSLQCHISGNHHRSLAAHCKGSWGIIQGADSSCRGVSSGREADEEGVQPDVVDVRRQVKDAGVRQQHTLTGRHEPQRRFKAIQYLLLNLPGTGATLRYECLLRRGFFSFFPLKREENELAFVL